MNWVTSCTGDTPETLPCATRKRGSRGGIDGRSSTPAQPSLSSRQHHSHRRQWSPALRRHLAARESRGKLCSWCHVPPRLSLERVQSRAERRGLRRPHRLAGPARHVGKVAQYFLFQRHASVSSHSANASRRPASASAVPTEPVFRMTPR